MGHNTFMRTSRPSRSRRIPVTASSIAETLTTLGAVSPVLQNVFVFAFASTGAPIAVEGAKKAGMPDDVVLAVAATALVAQLVEVAA